ncbi:MAG: histidine kinase, partial [Verrucomicrobiales bacterium]|nr:histidine kinase [Verrucomicrobiales bacterium]
MNPGSLQPLPSTAPAALLLCRRVFVLALVLLSMVALTLPHRASAAEESSVGLSRDVESPNLIGIGEIPGSISARKRVKIAGTLMSQFEPGYLILHDDTGEIRVRLRHATNNFHRGELLEMTGLPIRAESRAWLESADAKAIGQGKIPPPLPIRVSDALKDLYDAKYVVLRGQVVGTNSYTLRGVTNEVLLVDSEGVLCKVMFPWGTQAEALFPVGTLADFTGICRLGGRVDESRTRYLHILVHAPEAVHVLAGPSFWTTGRLRSSLAFMFVLLCVTGSWALFQWRKLKLLRASEERFRALIDNSFDVTTVLNADLSIKYMSPSGNRLFGTNNLKGAFDVIHPDDRPLIAQMHAEVLAKPASSRRISSYRLLAADGSLRYAEAIGTNCLHVPGVKGVVMNIRDITERKHVEEELRRSETVTHIINYFATSMLEQDTEEDILWDLAGNCISQLGFVDCVIYLLDPERKVLVQKAAMGPKSPQARLILNPIVIPLGEGIVGSVAASGRAELIANTTIDARYIVDDEHRLSEIAVPITVNGKVIGVIDSEHPESNFFTVDHLNALTAIASLCANKMVRIRAVQELRRLNINLEHHVAERTGELSETNTRLLNEITARESAEAELRVALEAEKELNQLKSLFVSMVSHEFRTPLGVILSSSNILDRYLDRLPLDKRKAQLRA